MSCCDDLSVFVHGWTTPATITRKLGTPQKQEMNVNHERMLHVNRYCIYIFVHTEWFVTWFWKFCNFEVLNYEFTRRLKRVHAVLNNELSSHSLLKQEVLECMRSDLAYAFVRAYT